MDGGLVSDRELVVSRGDGAEAFEAADGSFDRVAPLVDLAVERWRPPTEAAFGLAGATLVLFVGDDGLDAAAAQVGAVRARLRR